MGSLHLCHLLHPNLHGHQGSQESRNMEGLYTSVSASLLLIHNNISVIIASCIHAFLYFYVRICGGWSGDQLRLTPSTYAP